MRVLSFYLIVNLFISGYCYNENKKNYEFLNKYHIMEKYNNEKIMKKSLMYGFLWPTLLLTYVYNPFILKNMKQYDKPDNNIETFYLTKNKSYDCKFYKN